MPARAHFCANYIQTDFWVQKLRWATINSGMRLLTHEEHTAQTLSSQNVCWRSNAPSSAAHRHFMEHLMDESRALDQLIWGYRAAGLVLVPRGSSVKFVLVIGRTPCRQSFCVLCCGPIGVTYLREIATQLSYCGYNCYLDHHRLEFRFNPHTSQSRGSSARPRVVELRWGIDYNGRWRCRLLSPNHFLSAVRANVRMDFDREKLRVGIVAEGCGSSTAARVVHSQ